MSIPRMRTITEALAEIKMADAGSEVTANCIRTLCKNGQGTRRQHRGNIADAGKGYAP